MAGTPRTTTLLLLLLSVAFTGLPAVTANAQSTYEVEVGRLINPGDQTKESMRFYPSEIRVHQGDVLRFTSSGFHGVTLLPLGTSASEWAQDNAGGTGKPWSVFEADSDEAADALKVNLAAVFPNRDCGWPTQAPCDFDGRPTEAGDVLNSGLPLLPEGDSAEVHQLDYSVTINADPGEVLEVVDLVNPRMTMRIEVVGADDAASDPDVIAEEADATFAQDVAAANSLHSSYLRKKITKKIRGKTYRMAWAGIETPTVSLRGMYPKKIKIRAGQGVRWNFKKNVFSAYTVAFPARRAIAMASRFPVVACDPDGDVQEGAADTQPVSSVAPYCASYAELELEIPERLMNKAGDKKIVSRKDFGSSGLRGRGITDDASAYSLLFPKPSPRKGFTYASIPHEISGLSVTGKVVVRRGRR